MNKHLKKGALASAGSLMLVGLCSFSLGLFGSIGNIGNLLSAIPAPGSASGSASGSAPVAAFSLGRLGKNTEVEEENEEEEEGFGSSDWMKLAFEVYSLKLNLKKKKSSIWY